MTALWFYFGIGLIGALVNIYANARQSHEFTKRQQAKQVFILLFLWPLFIYVAYIHRDDPVWDR